MPIGSVDAGANGRGGRSGGELQGRLGRSGEGSDRPVRRRGPAGGGFSRARRIRRDAPRLGEPARCCPRQVPRRRSPLIAAAGACPTRQITVQPSVLSEAECFELLAVATVGRVGFVSPGGLQIIPVNYRLGAGHRIFIRISPNGTIAELAKLDSRVAFEVDYHADDFRIAWSVLMQGAVSLLDAEARAAYVDLHRPPVPWPGGRDRCPCSSCRRRLRPKPAAGVSGLNRYDSTRAWAREFRGLELAGSVR